MKSVVVKRKYDITLKVAEFKFFARCEHVEDFLPADAFTQKQVELEYKQVLRNGNEGVFNQNILPFIHWSASLIPL